MIEIKVSAGRVLVCLPEEFSYKLYREFRDIYQNNDPGVTYEVDFSKVKTIDSSSMGMLLLMHEYCVKNKSRIVLSNCDAGVSNILKNSTMASFFEVM